MCCLFGIVDYRHNMTVKQKNKILSALATAAEVRGTDATGIAYNSAGTLKIYKRPWPARHMRFRVPEDANVIMGHTRMTTQGSAKKNCNNHPFIGKTAGGSFALAHNGVLWNDGWLRKVQELPKVPIETDSFVAVQLIEQKNTLDFRSLQYMAEQVEGSFTFTVLDTEDNLFFVKGDSPMCIYQFHKLGFILYASTEEILTKALLSAGLSKQKRRTISLHCGEILRLDAAGLSSRSRFDDSNLFPGWRYSMWHPYAMPSRSSVFLSERQHLDEIKIVAMSFGFTSEDIDRLSTQGFSPDEIEELLYEYEM